MELLLDDLDALRAFLSVCDHKTLGRLAQVSRTFWLEARELKTYGERGRLGLLIDKGIQDHKVNVEGRYWRITRSATSRPWIHW